MSKKFRAANANNHAPYRASGSLPVEPAPLLTIERAIAEELCPTSLRQVAVANERKGGRRERQADNLHRIADKLELLGYGRGEARKEAA
ncbi:hypothetical protein BTE77_06910 [Ensifer adhaerens]|nr:hypothetical protein BTE77_06910 [Ensifer adhaerens]